MTADPSAVLEDPISLCAAGEAAWQAAAYAGLEAPWRQDGDVAWAEEGAPHRYLLGAVTLLPRPRLPHPLVARGPGTLCDSWATLTTADLPGWTPSWSDPWMAREPGPCAFRRFKVWSWNAPTMRCCSRTQRFALRVAPRPPVQASSTQGAANPYVGCTYFSLAVMVSLSAPHCLSCTTAESSFRRWPCFRPSVVAESVRCSPRRRTQSILNCRPHCRPGHWDFRSTDGWVSRNSLLPCTGNLPPDHKRFPSCVHRKALTINNRGGPRSPARVTFGRRPGTNCERRSPAKDLCNRCVAMSSHQLGA